MHILIIISLSNVKLMVDSRIFQSPSQPGHSAITQNEFAGPIVFDSSIKKKHICNF